MMEWFTPQLTADEQRAVADFMARLSTAPAPDSTLLHGPGAIWWKAQLLRRWKDQQQAARPLAVMEPIQVGASLVAAGLVFFWALPSLTTALTQVVSSLAR
jgi:hypothetical protein